MRSKFIMICRLGLTVFIFEKQIRSMCMGRGANGRKLEKREACSL